VNAGDVVNVLLCDDHAPTRRSYATLIGIEPDLRVVGAVGDGAACVAAVEQKRPDVVLMDIRMPVMDGLEATRRVQALPHPPKVVVLTTFDLDDYVFQALRAGASGFLLKDAPPGSVVDAVRVVARGDALLAPSVTRRLLDAFADRRLRTRSEEETTAGSLSARETDVLRLVGQGKSNAEIAAELFVEETTVKTYVSRILVKLGRRNRVELAIFCYENGLV
jgi:DNA-binding NarL/FixJ family response regulator